MARAENTEAVEQFERFFRDYYRNDIGELAREYPTERRSLYVSYNDLYRFDEELAEQLSNRPEELLEYAEEALRRYDLPVDVSLGQAHVRVTDVEPVEIRDIRARHRGQLISVQGIVRKATDVRPKVQEAAFECQRCGTLTRIPQTGGEFQEPHECGGCERQGPYRINYDQSEFVDAQKLRVQESPEGLRGGETPQSIDINIEDDVTGKVTAGDHVTVTGVLHLDQQESNNSKSATFDVYMDGLSVEIEDEQFEEMDISEEDKRRIIELSSDPDIYDKMVGSLAPSIYGYEREKLSIMLQLFSGVTKNLPDGSRIRGDFHILLIGDPGTGKCIKYDTNVTLADGRQVPIGELVEANLDDPTPVDDGVYDEVDIPLPSVEEDGTITERPATKVWKREAPERMYRLRTASGRTLEVTPSHPLFVQSGGRMEPVEAEELQEGQFVATPRSVPAGGDDTLDVDFRRSQANNAVRLEPPEEWTPWLARLVGYVVAEGHVVHSEDNTGSVRVINNDRAVLDDVAGALDRLGLTYTERDAREDRSARELSCTASELVTFLEDLEPALLQTSEHQHVPEPLFRASAPVRRGFLGAYVEGEGHVSRTQREITVASTSRELLEGVQELLTAFGIDSSVEPRSNGSYRLRIGGKDAREYAEQIGFVTERKAEAAAAFDGVDGNTNTDLVPNLTDDLARVREALALSQSDCGLPRSTYQHYERGDRNPSRESLQTVVGAFEDRLNWLRATRERLADGDWEDVRAVRSELGVSQLALAKGTDVTQGAISYYEREEVAPDGGTTAAARDAVLDRIDEALGVSEDVERLRDLADNDLRWDRIESVETVDPDYDWVYDLEVAGTHTYLSNGIVSHNSVLLQYVRNLAPRAVYTSGKGSSAAGLCVTGDTMVHAGEGFVPIRELATEHHPEPVSEETAAEASEEVYTFDPENGGIERTESSHVWRMPEKECREIETAHGKRLEASTDTPLLVCGEAGLEWRPISEVEPGDHVAVPKYGEIERSSPPVREFLEFTEEKLKPTEESVERIREGLCEEFGTLRDAAAALELPEDFVYDSLPNRHLPLERLERLLDAIGGDLEDIDIERAMLRHGDGVSIPDRFDEQLMYLVGLVFGDGDVMVSRRGGNRGHVRISNADETLLRRAADVIKRTFDKSVDIEYQDDRVPCIRLHSATVARLFSNLGVESPKEEIALDHRLTTAEHADAFLRGLFDADGSVSARESGGSSVQFSTTCEELARQVQLMLESYGIRARRRERDRRGTYELESGHEIESTSVQTHLSIYGADVDRFAAEIGFKSEEKAAALAEIVGTERRGERLPVGDALLRTDGEGGTYYNNVARGHDSSRARARELMADRDLGGVGATIAEVADADLRWDEVVGAADTGRKELFDLTVPGTQNFLGNGVVTHNTAAAVRDDFGDGQQWTLEAGALVLADQGVAAIDELDKMRCVTGDTLVHLGDGRVTRIRELARGAAESGSIEQLPNGRTIRDVGADAWTMDEDGNVVSRPVTAVHEYDAPETLRTVTLSTGETLTTTEDHPFFVVKDGERVEKAAAELDEEDWVYVPKSVPDAASDGGVAVAGGGTVAGDGPSPALGAVLGYLSGDGNVYYDRSQGTYGIRFTNSEEELLSDFERACRQAFGVEPSRPPSEQRDDGVETVRLSGKNHADAVLEAGMNLETYDGKSFPEAVTAGSRETKAAFVRALADSEGAVDTRTGNLRLFSSSYQLLLGTKEVLLKFGVSSQLQTRERAEGRDLHVLAITDADSLAAYERRIGFTLSRKQEALEEVVASADGDRTILDVIPGVGDLLRNRRKQLRLYQRECGIEPVTYCNFEQEDAHVSCHRARRILEAFEERRRQAREDRTTLGTPCSWEQLAELKERYHVSQSELAEGTPYRQPQVSERWGSDEQLRETLRERLRSVVQEVADTDLATFRSLVRGDVKWRQVEGVQPVEADVSTDRVPVLRRELADLLGCPTDEALAEARRLLATDPETESWESLRTELDRYGVSFQELAADLNVAVSTVSRWFNGVVDTNRFPDVRAAAERRIGKVRQELSRLLDEVEARRTPKVYDLTVEETHNFVANGMVVHNSEDRSALHEALEQQSISISKAGINATLKSRCALLGAANPKYGRFDEYEAIAEQIDLEPALISRFDLIFTVTDKPDPERDRELASHILNTNYAGELNTHRTQNARSDYSQEEVDSVTEDVEPAIEREILRKYVAYAKRTCFPVMTEEARDAIEEFYVDLRAEGSGEDSPVPVTARKLEGLVRLAEASARVRLSDRVEREDAERVIDIVRSSLEDIGMDPETGEFDVDMIETGTSKTQRDRIKNIKGIITEIEQEYDAGAPVEEVLDRAEAAGIERSKAEHEIEKLRTQGEVYEPQTDHLRSV